ncbi:methyltransferase domain-containing protein [Falsarthrobacter nasiphocae]|uniref:23S rRNA (Guanine745-N1)-methyltransferase n=1 Tax=Falsarthrobacter nasiphocae TaxID=189863 RepID=A0AAE4C481_9MICC|nr:methyltransferase domain-containing protein [Falsarthrobacter nasiphocae]MDR6891096.1 23S rRNA (guanine745-N1)-methyltransferase [Falsarthrobacter nasiphocae]
MSRPDGPGSGPLVCRESHRFDAARQGYVNLLVGAGTPFTPDTSAMILARERFQSAGHYAPLARRLTEFLSSRTVVDVGCGTGYYSAGSEYSELVAIDLSPAAARRAARLPRTLALVWDAWRPLPLADASVEAVLNVFAPHNMDEFARVLKPGGSIVVVTSGKGHLRELADAGLTLGQAAGKREALDAKAARAGFELAHRETLQLSLSLSPDDVADLAFMGPAGHHMTLEEARGRAHASQPERGQVTAVFDLAVFGSPAPAATR